MNMKTKRLVRYLTERFLFILLIIIVGAVLSYSIVTLAEILNSASINVGGKTSTQLTTFNQSTIDSINNLNDSSNNNATSSAEQATRPNPFTE